MSVLFPESSETLGTLADLDAAIYDGETLLYHASKQGNLELVQKLVAQHADINAQGFSGPALHESILQGQDLVTSFLVQQGADVNQRSFNAFQDGFAPLHTAVLCSNAFAMKLLVESNASLLVKDAEFNSPLHVAVKNGNHEAAKLLLSYGASMTAMNSNQETPFCLAIAGGNQKLLELFIDHGVLKDRQVLDEFLVFAIKAESVPVVKLMLQHGADVNFVSSYKRWTPLHHAAMTNSLPVVEILLENGADVTARTDTSKRAISFAGHFKNEAILDLLLQKHAAVGDPSLEGVQLLQDTIEEDCEFLVKKIVTCKSFDLNIDGFASNGVRFLEGAIVDQRENSVRALIYCGADVELTNSRGVCYWDLALELRNFDFFYSWVYNGGGFYHFWNRRDLYLSRLEKMIQVMETERPEGWKVEWEVRDHLILMKRCGFFEHSRHVALTNGYGTRERDTIEADCSRELEKLKTQVIAGVSGWDLLRMDDRRLGIWSRKVGGLDEMKQFEAFFYSRNWLNDCYRRGARRRRLVKALQECYWKILEILFDCLEFVVQYLDNDDIRSLIFACNLEEKSKNQ